MAVCAGIIHVLIIGVSKLSKEHSKNLIEDV